MILPKLRSPFKMECKERKQMYQRKKFSSPSGMDLGLRLLTQITNSNGKSNILVKSSLTKLNSNDQTSTDPLHFCFLKNCTLCNKQLAIDKDIYMYRGDQGFCSEECRNRQIFLDEMRELEHSNNEQMEVCHSHRHCWNDASSRETHLILEDLRRQRLLKSKQSPCCNQNHWAIVS